MEKKITAIKEIDGIRYYKYTPSLFRYYIGGYPEYKPTTISHFIRMTIEYLQGGFRVYYMYSKQNEVLGYLVVANGRRRLTCSKKEDIVIGPIWICPSKRGKGYGTKGIHAVLHELGESYQSAYEYIKTHNIASIRSVEKNGFKCLGYGQERGLLRKVYPAKEGKDYIFRYNHADRPKR